MEIYYIVKSGVYDHGVFWIGQDVNLAINKAKEYASNDIDNHHLWVVRKYVEIPESGAKLLDAAEDIFFCKKT